MNKILNMSELKHPGAPDIEAEARAWVIALDDEPSEKTQQEFRDWLQRSPSHREAFKQIASVWSGLDRWSEFLYLEGETLSKGAMNTIFSATRRLFNPVFAAASLAFLVLSISLFFYLSGTVKLHEDRFIAEYDSSIGEVKIVALPDGSGVHLNTHSKIAVAYADTSRVIHLTEGEAFFDVSHDSEKLFIVYAGKYAVKAVGTAFSVKLMAGGMELNVTDGRVEVATLPKKLLKHIATEPVHMTKATSIIPIVKGQRAILNEDQDELELVQKVKEEYMEKALSWRNGLLIFDDDPLQDVVKEINRYTSMRIVIADAAINDIRIGGYFRVNDVPVILNTIEEGFGLHVEQVDDELIYLMRQPSQQTTPQ